MHFRLLSAFPTESLAFTELKRAGCRQCPPRPMPGSQEPTQMASENGTGAVPLWLHMVENQYFSVTHMKHQCAISWWGILIGWVKQAHP